MKQCSTFRVSGKCKWKQWAMSTHLWECPKSRTLTPNADQDVEQHKLSFPAGGNAK